MTRSLNWHWHHGDDSVAICLGKDLVALLALIAFGAIGFAIVVVW